MEGSLQWLIEIDFEHVGVSKNSGTPKMDGLQWKTLSKMDDLGGPPLFLGTSM